MIAPNDFHVLSVFTPSNSTPEDLEFILVQRHGLLQDAVERVRESALTDHKHHLLFVGPRGCGKTHLITLIVHRVGLDTDLADPLRIAWLNEDETCTTLLEFLLKVHAALEKRYPGECRSESLSPAFEMKPAAALEFVSRQVLASLGPRTLMVAAENLDAIFENLGPAGQKQLRAFIQENPRLTFVATAQKLVESLSNRNSPFYGFFQTEHLKPLNVDDATELLKNIGRLRGNQEIVDFLSTSRGRSRVQALHHLSGGNHRIYIVLSQFITRDSVDALVGPFMKMVDELTPYYQERVRWLPAQQRKIVEYLCACETTVPVKDIAKRLFATPQTISSQLQDLREKGYVESNQRGRESLYEISEPLMRLCVEVKENQRHQPLRLLVDFLRVWYDDKEMIRRIEMLDPASSSRSYLEAAVERNRSEGSLRKKLLLEEYLLLLPGGLSADDKISLMETWARVPEDVARSAKYLSENDQTNAFESLGEAIEAASDMQEKAELVSWRASLNEVLGNYQDAIADCSCILAMPSVPSGLCIDVLVARGLLNLKLDRKMAAISDFESVTIERGATIHQVVSANFIRGVLHWNSGDWERGIQALEDGLCSGREAGLPFLGTTSSLILNVFSAGLAPALRQSRVSEVFQVFKKYQSLSALGEGLIKHLGGQFVAKGEVLPFSDNLEQWATSWEQAAAGVDEFRLPLRLLRTGVDFLIAGGKDEGILLRLTSAEREILKQAFGLAEGS